MPLIGAALGAVQCIMEESNDDKFAFFEYSRSGLTTCNPESSELDKWFKLLVEKWCTIHIFMHSM